MRDLCTQVVYAAQEAHGASSKGNADYLLKLTTLILLLEVVRQTIDAGGAERVPA
jgi:hypothetical protein